MIKFIILTRQRSGSTVLIRSLDEHPEIFCAGEIFYNGNGIYHQECKFPFVNVFPQKSKLNILLNLLTGSFKVDNHLKKFYSTSDGVKAKGFKLMLSQIKILPSLNKWLEKEDIKKIVLVRDNPIEVYISGLKAKTDGKSHVEKGEKHQSTAIHLDKEKLLNGLRKIESENQKLKEFAKSNHALLINYDEFFEWNKMTDKIFDYLGIDSKNIEPVLQKRSKKRIEDNISNYTEIAAYLKETEFKKYL